MTDWGTTTRERVGAFLFSGLSVVVVFPTQLSFRACRGISVGSSFGHARVLRVILASMSRGLYIGVTNNLERRLFEHRQKLIPGFTSKYNVTRLVYFELSGQIPDALAREK